MKRVKGSIRPRKRFFSVFDKSGDIPAGAFMRRDYIFTTKHLRWLVLAVLGSGGCGSSRGAVVSDPGQGSRAAQGAAMSGSQISPCSPDGPSLQVTLVEVRAGKPPTSTYSFDARIHNPLTQPIWLIYNLADGLPKSVWTVWVSETPDAPVRYQWSFRGEQAMDAVRIGPRGDVVLRGLTFQSRSQSEPTSLALARSIAVDGRPALEWMGHRDDASVKGEVDMHTLIVEREKEAGGNVPVQVGVICGSRIDLSSDSPAWKGGT
jgi:hypothetical protein